MVPCLFQPLFRLSLSASFWGRPSPGRGEGIGDWGAGSRERRAELLALSRGSYRSRPGLLFLNLNFPGSKIFLLLLILSKTARKETASSLNSYLDPNRKINLPLCSVLAWKSRGHCLQPSQRFILPDVSAIVAPNTEVISWNKIVYVCKELHQFMSSKIFNDTKKM